MAKFLDSPKSWDSSADDLIPDTPPEPGIGSKTPMTWRNRKIKSSDEEEVNFDSFFLSKLVQTCPSLSKLIQTCLNLPKSVQT